MDDLGGRAEHLQVEPEVERALDLRMLARQQVVEPVAIGLVEPEIGLEVGEHAELGVEAGLDRALAQQARAEGVDRLDPRAVEGSQGLFEALASGLDRTPRQPLARVLLGREPRARPRRPP